MNKVQERFNKSWKEEEDDLLLKLRDKGLSHKEISRIMKRSEHAIMCRFYIIKNDPKRPRPLKVSATETIDPPFEVTMDGKYETVKGHEVRIYAVYETDGYCVHGAVHCDPEWVVCSWTINGEHVEYSQYDLKVVKPKIQREIWLWVAQDRALACISKETAQQKVELDGGLAVLVNIDHEIGIVHG